MEWFYIISYGSNMCLNRIKQRVKSVEFIKPVKLEGYKLVFNKKSKDGSSKANLEKSETDYVWAILQRIKMTDKPKLDKFEGLGFGYELKEFRVDSFKAWAYICEDSNYKTEDKPYDWYLDFLIKGTEDAGIDPEYLKVYESKLDLDQKRKNENMKLL